MGYILISWYEGGIDIRYCGIHICGGNVVLVGDNNKM